MLRILYALLRASFKTHLMKWQSALTLGFAMFAQNFIFFILWLVFFESVHDIKGWQLTQVAILYGFVAEVFGFSLFFCDGPRTLARHVVDGTFDSFLLGPTHPLPRLLFSRSSAASLGDMLSGPFYWFFFAGLSVPEMLGGLCLAVVAAIVLNATVVLFYSMAFWLRSSARLSDQFFEMLVIFTATPLPSQNLPVKIVMFTLLPAGFIGYLPVQILSDFNPWRLAMMIAAAVLYGAMAYFVFNRGVARYRRG